MLQESIGESGPVAPHPPLTNRGCGKPPNPPPDPVGPDSAISQSGGVDWLNLTVDGDFNDICEVIRNEFQDTYAPVWGPDDEVPDCGFIVRPLASSRVESVLDLGGVFVQRYRPQKGADSPHHGVYLRGQDCDRLGNAGVQTLCRLLDRFPKCRASRVDFYADTRSFTPDDAYDAIRRGDVRSRCVSPDAVTVMRNDLGTTVYLGLKGELGPCGSPRVRQKGEYFGRIYDARGYTRYELQCRGAVAKGASRFLLDTPADEWPDLALRVIAKHCEYVDRSSSSRLTRCVRLPWWERFMDGADPVSVRYQHRTEYRTPDDRLAYHLRRSLGTLLFAKHSQLGDEGFCDWIRQQRRFYGSDDAVMAVWSEMEATGVPCDVPF